MTTDTSGGLYFEGDLDNKKIIAAIEETKRRIQGLSDGTASAGEKMDDTFKSMAKYAGAYFSVQQLQSFASNIIKVRGEIEQLEISFTTMLRSKQEADQLMSQIIDAAAKTPYGLQDVATGAKQLLAYGASADTVIDTLKQLGNIASDIGAPLNDIVYLYGTTMTQGRLYSQDLNQFLGRGIPMVRELANIFGVAESQVKKLVEEGKVGFPEVQKVIDNLTGSTGMFYNLMESQSASIAGKLSNLGDSFDQMLNEIGKSNTGMITGAIDGISSLIDNYEKNREDTADYCRHVWSV